VSNIFLAYPRDAVIALCLLYRSVRLSQAGIVSKLLNRPCSFWRRRLPSGVALNRHCRNLGYLKNEGTQKKLSPHHVDLTSRRRNCCRQLKRRRNFVRPTIVNRRQFERVLLATLAFLFTARCHASAVLAMGLCLCLSVCLFVCLCPSVSVTIAQRL